MTDKDIIEQIVFPEMDGIQTVFLPAAKTIFSSSDYLMPDIIWLNKERLDAALGAVKNIPDNVIFPERAARLIYYVVKGHGILDGNKRMGIIIGFTFLELNGWEQNPSLTMKQVVDFIEKLVESKQEDMELKIVETSDWIKSNFTYSK